LHSHPVAVVLAAAPALLGVCGLIVALAARTGTADVPALRAAAGLGAGGGRARRGALRSGR
ncbi:MAG: hypothetical protein ABS955_11840, partial [Stenotrophomonas maltophilia]